MKVKKTETRFLEEQEADAIKLTCMQLGISQNELAKRLGVSISYLSMVMQGKRAFTHDLEARFNEIGWIIK